MRFLMNTNDDGYFKEERVTFEFYFGTVRTPISLFCHLITQIHMESKYRPRYIDWRVS